MLNDVHKNQVTAWLKEKGVRCGACGQNERWRIVGRFGTLAFLADDGGRELSPPRISTEETARVEVVCAQCAHVMLFDAYEMGFVIEE